MLNYMISYYLVNVCCLNHDLFVFYEFLVLKTFYYSRTNSTTDITIQSVFSFQTQANVRFIRVNTIYYCLLSSEYIERTTKINK